jgi:hypothetical protein
MNQLLLRCGISIPAYLGSGYFEPRTLGAGSHFPAGMAGKLTQIQPLGVS